MIIVLGASGNIGSATIEALKGKHAKFRAGYRDAKAVKQAAAQGIDAVVADYDDPSSLERVFAGIDQVFFVNPPVPQMVQQTTNVVNAARRAGVKHLIKASVWGAENDDFAFAHPHRASEKVVESSGLAFTFVRPNGFFQNMLGLKPLIDSQGMFAQPDADPAVSEVDVRDIGDVAAAVLTSEGHGGKGYKVGGPEAITGAKKAEILSSILGREIRCQVVPGSEWKKAAVGFGVPDWQADGIIDLTRYYAAGKASQIVDTVPRLTGKPARSFEQFAREFFRPQ